MEDQYEFVEVAVGNELVTNAWASISGKKKILLRSLLKVNTFDVELTKQACVPINSSLSLTTLSSVPSQDSKQIFHLGVPTTYQMSAKFSGAGWVSGLEVDHVGHITF